MDKQKIIFRADGNSKIGLGHISRCLALAEILSKNYYISFALQDPDQCLLKTIKKAAHETITLKQADATDLGFLKELEPYLTGEEIIVLDGYSFNLLYEQGLKKSIRAVVCIDDIPSRHFASDLIFNFCGALSGNDYSREFYTQVFAGLEFVFLRLPFLRKPLENRKYNNRLFLNMGGADLNNNTLRILNELISQHYSGEIEVVIGNNYPYVDSLDAIYEKRDSIRVHQGLSAVEMYDSMNRCTLAIVPPSTVALEFLSTGGLTFLHQTASNQALQMKYLIQSNLAFDYSDFKSIILNDPEPFFQRSTSLQKKVFDGSSIARVEKIFNNLCLSLQLSMRRAVPNDMRQCFEWANDPDARKYSYSSTPITWEQHVQWFGRKLADSNCYYFIADIGNSNAGQIRFDFLEDENAFQISYALDPQWRGKGLGYYLLIKGIQELNLLTPVKRIIGYVHEINSASVKAFQKAGFEKRLSKKYPNSFKFELSLIAI